MRHRGLGEQVGGPGDAAAQFGLRPARALAHVLLKGGGDAEGHVAQPAINK